MKLPHMKIVTASGAHATGKSTMLADLAARLMAERPNAAVHFVESCSQRLFDRMRDGSLAVPGGVVPETYEDINRLGLRSFFQRQLPDALAFEVEATVLRAANDRPVSDETYVLVDRWFTDIYAYTQVESDDTALWHDMLELCRSRLSSLLSCSLSHARGVRLVNAFVPLRHAKFKVAPSKKFRATCDPELWERICLARWDEVVGDHKSFYLVTTSNRADRVTRLLSHLEATSDEHAQSKSK